MASDRRLVLGAVSLVPGRVRGDLQALRLANDEVETMLPPEFFAEAPFERISAIIRYGEQTQLAPQYQRLIKKASALPIAVEVEMVVLRKADPDTLHRIFRQALLEALIAVAEKYGLPSEQLREERIRTGDALKGSS